MPSLAFIGDENITVNTDVQLTTAQITKHVSMASIHVQSGGAIYHRVGAVANNDGSGGETGQAIDDHFEIWGNDALLALHMIKKSGESNAEIGVSYWGDGGVN